MRICPGAPLVQPKISHFLNTIYITSKILTQCNAISDFSFFTQNRPIFFKTLISIQICDAVQFGPNFINFQTISSIQLCVLAQWQRNRKFPNFSHQHSQRFLTFSRQRSQKKSWRNDSAVLSLSIFGYISPFF